MAAQYLPRDRHISSNTEITRMLGDCETNTTRLRHRDVIRKRPCFNVEDYSTIRLKNKKIDPTRFGLYDASRIKGYGFKY